MKTAVARRLAGRLAGFEKLDGPVSRMKEVRRREHFQELSDCWDLWYELFYRNDPPGMTVAEYQALTLREADVLFPWLPPDATFLDLACGDGRILRLVAPRCRRAHGLDISKKGLANARRLCRGLDNISLHRAAGWKTGFADGEFDLVFCHLMLSHIDVEAAVMVFQEVRRILKPGGRFVFDLPNLLFDEHLSYLAAPERTNWPGIHRPRFWTAEMAQALLPRCGFAVEQVVAGRFIEVRAAKA